MPQLGETVVEGTITKWLKKEGERIERDEPLFEISTDKVDTEVPSPLAGTVAQILVPEGETVGVGTELAMIDSGDGQGAAADQDAGTAKEGTAAAGSGAEQGDAAEGAGAEAPGAEPGSTAAKASDAERTGAPRRDEGPPGNGQAAAAAAPAPRAQTTTADAGPRSQILSPLVRRLAEEHQIDLGQV